jgi:hypothetical protein
MLYVVEIQSREGDKAVKEYEATSSYELVFVVAFDLKPYPDFKVVNAWQKADPAKIIHIS